MGRDDISRVRDLSLGGLFFVTRKARAIGTTVKVDFLVQEGQIRADAIVKHRMLDQGWGLKFTAITEQDRPRFAALMRRLRGHANEVEQGIVATDAWQRRSGPAS
jgi:PilZ domain